MSTEVNKETEPSPLALALEICGNLKELRDLARKIDTGLKKIVALGGSSISLLQASRIDKEGLKTAKVLLRCHATIDNALGGWKNGAKIEQRKRKEWLAKHKPPAGSLVTRSYSFLRLLASSTCFTTRDLGRLGIAASAFGRRYDGTGSDEGRQAGLNIVEEVIRSRCSAISKDVVTLPPDQSAWKLLICSTESSFKDENFENGVLGKGVYSHLRHAVLPQGTTSIGPKAFYFKSGLKTMVMPETLTTIDDEAFYGCTSVNTLDLPSSLRTIGKCTFYECSALAHVSIPAGVNSIGEAAFGDCTGLVSITLPAGLSTIADATFKDCSSLEQVQLIYLFAVDFIDN